MLLGVAAAVTSFTQPSFDFYSGAHLVMDFVNGVYRLNGVDAAVNDLFTHTPDVTGNVLVCDWTTPDTPYTLSAMALAALPNTGFTMLIDFLDMQRSPSGNTIIAFNHESSSFNAGHTDYFNLWIDNLPATMTVTDQNEVAIYRDLTAASPPGDAARMNFAVTRNQAHLAICVNGGSVLTDTTVADSDSMQIDAVTIGGYYQDTFFDIDARVRRLIIYPVRPDADLPVITTES